MSYRSFLARVAVTAGYSHEAAEDIVQKALDEHAHELAEQPPTLTPEERQFLSFALDQAGEEMSLRDGFTDADAAALEKFRGWVADPQATDDHWAPESGTS